MKLLDKLEVTCTSGISKSCIQKSVVTYRSYSINIEKNKSYICRSCATAPSLLKRNAENKYGSKYELNHLFFDNKSLLNCYWAGFIAADGCLWSNSNAIAIKISSKDRVILDRFKEDIEYTGNILEVSSQNQCRIIIHSSKLRSDLHTSFNIHPAKSMTLMPPNLTDEDLIKSFIVGYIDGDGSICKIGVGKKNCTTKLGICGTKEFLEWILSWFNIWTEPTKAKKSIQERRKGKNVYELCIYGNRAGKLISILNDVPVRKLARKWSKIR